MHWHLNSLCSLYCTHSGKVAISLDGHRQLTVAAGLVVDDDPELLDEVSEYCCIGLPVLHSPIHYVNGYLEGWGGHTVGPC